MFILSKPLNGLTLDVLKDIVQASNFHYVIIITSLSPAMHSIVRFGPGEEENRALEEVEELLLDWMGSQVNECSNPSPFQ